MFRHEGRSTVPWRVYLNWFLLSFLAGSVNVGGYLGCHRFVSHVTGFATLFGGEGARGDWDRAIGILSVPLFFLMGVMLSAFLVDRPRQAGRRPHYPTVMALVAICLGLAAIGGYLHWFGEFGAEPRLKRDYFLLALLCGASGLQNAAISTATGSRIRTTHLTGLTTDLGTGLVRLFYLDSKSPMRNYEVHYTGIRIGTIASFAAGSLVGGVLFLNYAYLGFLMPTGLALYSMHVALTSQRRLVRLRRHHHA